MVPPSAQVTSKLFRSATALENCHKHVTIPWRWGNGFGTKDASLRAFLSDVGDARRAVSAPPIARCARGTSTAAARSRPCISMRSDLPGSRTTTGSWPRCSPAAALIAIKPSGPADVAEKFVLVGITGKRALEGQETAIRERAPLSGGQGVVRACRGRTRSDRQGADRPGRQALAQTRDGIEPRSEGAARKRSLAACSSRAAGRAAYRLTREAPRCTAPAASTANEIPRRRCADRRAGRATAEQAAEGPCHHRTKIGAYLYGRIVSGGGSFRIPLPIPLPTLGLVSVTICKG